MVGNFVCLLGALGLLGRRFIGRIVLRVPRGFHSEPRPWERGQHCRLLCRRQSCQGWPSWFQGTATPNPKNALLEGGLSDVFLGDTLVNPSAPIRGGSTQRAAQEVPGHWNSDQLRLVTFANLVSQRILDDFKS